MKKLLIILLLLVLLPTLLSMILHIGLWTLAIGVINHPWIALGIILALYWYLKN